MRVIFPCFILLLVVFQGSQINTNSYVCTLQQNKEIIPLSQEEKEILLYIREQQWMTSDVCNYFLVIYPMPEFQQIGLSNLNQSEAAHLLLLKNHLDDPVLPHFPGRYSVSGITDQFNKLTNNGKSSQNDALASCFELGEYNLYKYLEFEAKIHNPDLTNLLSVLINCAKDQVRVLVEKANERKLTFNLQYISMDQLSGILKLPH